MRNLGLLVIACLLSVVLQAQSNRWQQQVKYKMDVTVVAEKNQFSGKQQIEYTNNSPDTLKRVFYHLYWNAFQPNSMMDARSRVLGQTLVYNRPDWDGRVRDRIQKLQPNEIGYQKVKWVKLNGVIQSVKEHETVLEVVLNKPILPNSKVNLELEFEAQVPLQVRRSGRDNAEGVRFSMSQWYPKLCEYDYEGWHPTPYIAREFYGIWGDYEVKITIDKKYVIGGTGYLQNPNQIGYGYEGKGAKVTQPAGNLLTWHFVAPNVHDFVWAADPEYKHLTKTVRDGLVLHAFYKIVPDSLRKQYNAMSDRAKRFYGSAENFIANYKAEWETVLELAAKALPFIDKTFGKYPYKQYSFIQGGDGGMEYPMATLLKGAGEGVTIHEWMHSWYQMMLGTNESLHSWMDEGFTSYAESRITNFLEGDTIQFPHKGAYDAYIALTKSGFDEPLTTHADQYNTNYAYSTNAYTKGEVFMEQLGYIVGAPVRDKILLEYFNRWKFKHPNPADIIRVAEDVSGIQLDWYRTFFVNTNKTVNYGIDSIWTDGDKTKIRLSNKGRMPMPIDVQLTFKDGSKELHYIPMYLMFGKKPIENTIPRTDYEPWKWTHSTYIIETTRKLTDISIVEIDPTLRLADVERKDNRLEVKW